MTPEANVPVLDGSGPVVLKIGGSVMRLPQRLRPVIDVLARARRPFAAVTGGGAFADQVRTAQPQLGFCDETAHRMAILALHQTAWMMASFLPATILAESVRAIGERLNAGGQALWLPLEDCLRDPELPATWETTSDAIAARLAERLGGLPLVFIKSRGAHGSSSSPADLAAEGLIDPRSAEIVARGRLPFGVVVADDTARLAHLLAAEGPLDAPARKMLEHAQGADA